MNIGFFTDTYYPDINGVVSSILMLQGLLKARGHTVYIFAPSKHQPAGQDDQLVMMRSIPLFFMPAYRLSGVYSVRKVRRIKEMKLDVIHTHSEFSLGVFAKLVARELRIPMVHTYHTLWEDYLHYVAPDAISRSGFTKEAYRRIVAMFLSGYKEIIAPSAAIETYLEQDCGLWRKSINVIPTGIQTDLFLDESIDPSELQSLREEHALVGRRVILYVGRLAKEKSIDIVIDALPAVLDAVPDAMMLVVGGGPEKDALVQQCEALGISQRVVFAGSVPFEKIGLYYKLGEVFVTASTSETQGLTYFEAASAGLPVVAKYAPNLEGVFEDGENALLFHDVKELSVKLISVLSDGEAAARLVQNAQTVLEQFHPDRFVDNVCAVYERAIQRHKLTPRRRDILKRIIRE